MARKSAKDIELEIGLLKIFGLGDYGTGKSVFASTFPTPGFVFDFDQRIETYRGRDFEYESFKMTPDGWVSFEKCFREVRDDCAKGVYKTVVLDSSSSMTDTAMERAMQLDPKRTAEGGPIWNVHYQIVKNLVEPKLHAILSFPAHVIVLGHWKVETDPKTGNILRVDPLLTGNLSEKIPGYFNEVYAFFTKPIEGKEHFFLRTVTRGYYKARSTVSGPYRLLPDEIPNNYVSLMKHMEEARRKEVELRHKKQEKDSVTNNINQPV